MAKIIRRPKGSDDSVKPGSIVAQFRETAKAREGNKGAAQNNKSLRWFKETVAKSAKNRQSSKLLPGRMYAYAYDAKNKATLAYWDRYPLIIALKTDGAYVLGLNLHYIPPRARIVFMEKLLTYLSKKNFSDRVKLNVNWDKVKSIPGATSMIKLYLKSHMKTAPTEVPPTDWYNAVHLPLQSFQSKGKRYSARKVWGQR